MKKVLQIISAIGLALTVLQSLLVLYGGLTWKTHAQLMFAGMLVWFFTAPFWMKAKTSEM